MTFSWTTPAVRPILVAHRGSSGEAPENTLKAFYLAREEGADAVELDVHLSKDGHVVVIHDERIDRTTDGTGPVRNYTLRQLKKYNAAVGWKRQYGFEEIPTLEEVFAYFGDTIGINVEIKRERSARAQFELLKKCVFLVHKFKLTETVLISSFIRKVLEETGMLDNRLIRGLLYDPLMHAFRSPFTSAKSIGAKYLIVNRIGLKKRTEKFVHANNMLIGAYTINTDKQARKSLRYGIDAVITNFPSTLIASLKKK